MDRGDDFVFIDVREGYDYAEFNLGSRLIPLGELMGQLENITDQKHTEIVVHCKSGDRSRMAKTLLTQAGYANVRNLLGGVLAWQEKYGSAKV